MTKAPPMILVAHRGGAGEAPENTVEAFAHAKSLGLDAFELDVRLSKDDQAMVLHDVTLDRTTDQVGELSQFTAAQLREVDARAGFADWPNDCWVPTLDQVLDEIADARLILVEFKRADPATYERLCQCIRELVNQTPALGRSLVIGGWDDQTLKVAARDLPDLARSYIVSKPDPTSIEFTLAQGCQWFMPKYSEVSQRSLEQAKQRGLNTVVWTPNQAHEITAAANLKPDALITDFPTRAKPILQ